MAKFTGTLRFMTWWFVSGGLVPILLTLVGYLKTSWVPGEHVGSLLWILTWIVWPSWIVMIDAEHTAQIIVMLLLSVVLNGLWYCLFGFIIWQLIHRGETTEPQA